MTKIKQADKFDYLKLTKELGEIMERLESGELTVDEAVTIYERGLTVVTALETNLKNAENRVVELRTAYEAQTEAQSLTNGEVE